MKYKFNLSSFIINSQNFVINIFIELNYNDDSSS